MMLPMLLVLTVSILVKSQAEEACQCDFGSCNVTTSIFCHFTNDSCSKSNCPVDFPIHLHNISTSNLSHCFQNRTLTNVCQKCDDSCKEGMCSNTALTCTECASGYKEELTDKGSKVCERDCYSKRFPDQNYVCMNCNSVVDKCIDCEAKSDLDFENFWDECNKTCGGVITTPTNLSLKCDKCSSGYLLYDPPDVDFCTCCVENCPEGTESKGNKCVIPEESPNFCEKQRLVCEKIFPAIGGGLLFVICLIICVYCIWCRKKTGNDPSKKTIELPTKNFVDQVTRKQRDSYQQDGKSQEDETRSQDSATAIPLLDQGNSHKRHNSPQKLGTGNEGADVIDSPQENYENVPGGPVIGPHGGQEIYENTEPAAMPKKGRKSVPPKLPPRRGEEHLDYVNEDTIKEVARSNPHLKMNQNQVPPPSGKGHAIPSSRGYANQEVIDKFKGHDQGQADEGQQQDYQNVDFDAKGKKPRATGSGRSNNDNNNGPGPIKPKPKGVDGSLSKKSGALSKEVLGQSVPLGDNQKEGIDYYNMPGKTYYNKQE